MCFSHANRTVSKVKRWLSTGLRLRKYSFERDLDLYWKCKRAINICRFFMKFKWVLVSTPLRRKVWWSWRAVWLSTCFCFDQFFGQSIDKVSRDTLQYRSFRYSWIKWNKTMFSTFFVLCSDKQLFATKFFCGLLCFRATKTYRLHGQLKCVSLKHAHIDFNHFCAFRTYIHWHNTQNLLWVIG